MVTFAKHAVAFPKISRPILIRANSARSRAIAICSALIGLLSAPVRLPYRLAFDSVEQGLINHAQCPGRPSNALPTLGQTHCFLLEIQRVASFRAPRSASTFPFFLPAL